MDALEIRCGSLTAFLDDGGAVLRLRRARDLLPWRIDLQDTSQLTVRSGSAETSHRIRLADLTLNRLSPHCVQWVGEISDAPVALEIDLQPDGLSFRIATPQAGKAIPIAATWPGAILASGDSREICWSDSRQGALFRNDGQPWKHSFDWTGSVMRLGGITCDGESLAVIVETPFDARSRLSDDGQQSVSFAVEFLPSLGSLAYARRVRLLPLKESGYVAIANAFRKYAQDNGLWMSWDARVDANPNVAKLKGAFVACAGYFHDDQADISGAMKKMKALGFQRGYLFSPKFITPDDATWMLQGSSPNRMTDDHLRKIQDLGYLCAPFLQVEQAAPAVGPELFATDLAGRHIDRWQMGDTRYFEVAKWRVLHTLPRFDELVQSCNAIHFDTLTAAGVVEHAGERSYDRTGDARLRTDIAEYYRRRGKVVAAEGMRDWGVRVCDLGTHKMFTPCDENDSRIWRVPLTDLVYHDSFIRCQWEHHAYDDGSNVLELTWRRYHPFAQYLTDLLTASPPVLFPEGMLVRPGTREVAAPDGTRRLEVRRDRCKLYRKRFTDPETQAALPKALRACRLNERHGTARMTSHRFLDDASPFVQESEFDTGLHVIVNFSDEPYVLSNGRTVAARAARIDDGQHTIEDSWQR